MALWDDIKGKLAEGAERAKKGIFFAADKTKKGANIAKIQVEIKIEQGKLHKLYAELGKYVNKLMSNGVYDMSNDAAIRKLMDQISEVDTKIMKYNEEMRTVS